MADGQAYVTVQADENAPAMYAAGSGGTQGGNITLGVKISWTFTGGITDQYGWDNPRKVYYVPGDAEATDAAVSAAYNGASFEELMTLAGCVK